jgi:hypothetical protein
MESPTTQHMLKLYNKQNHAMQKSIVFWKLPLV